ncbi:hypothetical protein AAVH_22131 [Aphelenchoides avenae]|nr:hypothetical protein AAVH_22131 [Aphelenchus avenae]
MSSYSSSSSSVPREEATVSSWTTALAQEWHRKGGFEKIRFEQMVYRLRQKEDGTVVAACRIGNGCGRVEMSDLGFLKHISVYHPQLRQAVKQEYEEILRREKKAQMAGLESIIPEGLRNMLTSAIPGLAKQTADSSTTSVANAAPNNKKSQAEISVPTFDTEAALNNFIAEQQQKAEKSVQTLMEGIDKAIQRKRKQTKYETAIDCKKFEVHVLDNEIKQRVQERKQLMATASKPNAHAVPV